MSRPFRRQKPDGSTEFVPSEIATNGRKFRSFTEEEVDQADRERVRLYRKAQRRKDAMLKKHPESASELDELLDSYHDAVSSDWFFAMMILFDGDFHRSRRLAEGRDKGLAYRNEGRDKALLSILRTVENLKYRNPDWSDIKSIREALKSFKTDYGSKKQEWDRQRWWPDVKADDGKTIKPRGAPSVGTVRNYIAKYRAGRWPPSAPKL